MTDNEIPMGPVSHAILRQALAENRTNADRAMELLETWFDEPVERVPGMPTLLRLAFRLSLGRTVEQAAAREYVYRWHLALQGRAWQVPHCLGS